MVEAKAWARAGESERAGRRAGPVPSSTLSRELDRLELVSKAEWRGGGLALINPVVTSRVVSEKKLSGARVEVETEETVRFDFGPTRLGADVVDLDPSVDFTSERYMRRTVMEPRSGAWQVVSSTTEAFLIPEIETGANHERVIPDSSAVDERQYAGPLASQPDEPLPSSEAKVVVTGDGSRTNFVNYMARYAISPNSAYRYFEQDCANFVSQALFAGGWDKRGMLTNRTSHAVWWYDHDGIDEWSYSWSVADYFYWFQRNSGRARIVKYSQDLGKGDVIAINFRPTVDSKLDHVLGVTKKEGSVLWVSGHTNNYYNKRFRDVVTQYSSAHFSRMHFTYGEA